MEHLSKEEQFILNVLQTQGENKTMQYRDLQEACANEFEGVRLIVKKLKEKGLVEYEGGIPSLTGKITAVT